MRHCSLSWFDASGEPTIQVGFAAIKSPFRTYRIRRDFAEGLSVAQMMLEVGMMPDAPARVFLGDRLIADAQRATTLPRAGEIVTVRAIPAGHGKNPLEIGLEVVVAVAASLASAGIGTALTGVTIAGTTISQGAADVIGSVVGAGLGTLGKAEITSAFSSAPKNLPKIQSTPASYSISGNENITAPFSVIPRVYGQRRIYPMLAAPSFNESGGNSHNELYTNEYLRMLFVLGYGPLDITQIKIGDTLLSDYEDVQWEVRAGYPDDAPPSLYTGAVMETSFNIQLVKSGNPPQTLGWQTQTTGEGADEIAIQITWPEGFWEVNNVGNDHGEHMRIQVQYRLHGSTGTWSTRPDFIASGPSRRTLTYTDRWAVPNGQYDVQVQVESFWYPGSPVSFGFDTYWTALYTIRNSAPFAMNGLALIALRIRASNQLNGAISNLNCLAQSVLPDYDGVSTWYGMAGSWSYDYETEGNGAAYALDSATPYDSSAQTDTRWFHNIQIGLGDGSTTAFSFDLPPTWASLLYDSKYSCREAGLRPGVKSPRSFPRPPLTLGALLRSGLFTARRKVNRSVTLETVPDFAHRPGIALALELDQASRRGAAPRERGNCRCSKRRYAKQFNSRCRSHS